MKKLKLFLVTFSYGPGDLRSCIYCGKSRKAVRKMVVKDWDNTWTELVYIETGVPKNQSEVRDRVEYRIDPIPVEEGMIHAAFNCC